MALGNTTNNPGNLLSNSGNWLGLTGTTQANGLGYDVFDQPSSGVRALAIDLKNAIANGANTLTALVAHYLGNPVKNGVIQPTSANPNPGNYLATVEQVTGLGANASLTSANVSSLAKGFIKAEGSSVSDADYNLGISRAGLGAGTMTAAQTGVTGALQSWGSDIQTGFQSIVTDPFGSASILSDTFGAGLGATLTNPAASLNLLTTSASTGTKAVTQAAADTSSQAIKAAGDSIGGSIASLQGFFSNIFNGNNLERGVLIVVGILLLAAAVFALSKNYVPPAAAALA